MLKRVLLALMYLCMASQAFAGPQPPDVPAFVFKPPVYQTGAAANVSIDARVTPPYRGLTDIPTTTGGESYTAVATEGDSDFLLGGAETGGVGHENKFRTACQPSLIANDDPIRNYGQPGTSHLHLFYGATKVNAWTTYASLRNSKISNCAGISFNNSAYWIPAFTKIMPDGKKYALRPAAQLIYYVNNDNPDPHATAHLPIGLRWVSGQNMTDDWDWLKTIIANTNAQPGTAGRYQFYSQAATYKCLSTGSTSINAPYIKAPDGSDPWGGTCGPGIMQQTIVFSACWDGVNLWSPDGYHHVIPAITDTYYSNRGVCPKNWYFIPRVSLASTWAHTGASDYMNWTLSSDAAFQSVVNAGSNPHTIGSGESLHADELLAWDKTTQYAFETNCAGVEDGRAHECNDSRINSTTKLGLSTVISPSMTGDRYLTRESTSTANMWLAPPTDTTGGHNHMIHGMNDNMPMPGNDNTQLAGVEPIDFDLKRVGR